MNSRKSLTLLLLAVFAFNFLETAGEKWLTEEYNWGLEWRQRLAYASTRLEGELDFESHELTNNIAIYGYSVSYFFGLPLLFLAVAVALWRRQSISGYRVLSLALAVDYWLSLPFFLLFPVPERWSYPSSEAILLSDNWTSALITGLRPVSGIDNSFPSFHVSMAVVLIAVGYLCRIRLRRSVLAFGLTIVLSTFVLGIHWIPDMIAGLAVGLLSVLLAVRLESRLSAVARLRPRIA